MFTDSDNISFWFMVFVGFFRFSLNFDSMRAKISFVSVTGKINFILNGSFHAF